MSVQQQSETCAEPTTAAVPPLRLLLSCPKCGVSGWIKWASLKRGIRCPKCRCEFLIGSGGQVHKVEELPQTRFTCPRCGKSGAIAATFVVQKAECGDCRLPLVAGPDRKLHGMREAAAMQRAAKSLAQPTYREWLEGNFRRADGRVHRGYAMAAAGLTMIVLLSAGFAFRAFFDNSPETMARRFTAQCLAGDFQAATRYLPDDDVQRVEFKRWRMRHFTSIIAKFRPTGDRVGLTATPLELSEAKATLQIEMTSNHLGSRSIKQVWRTDESGGWQFDVCGTLAAEDGYQVPAALPAASSTARHNAVQ